MLAATELTHISWMINQTGAGGYSPADPKVAAGVRKMGYNLHVPQADFNSTAAGSFKVGVTVQNDGVAPFYYPWKFVLGLRDSSGTVVKTWDADWDIRTVQPFRSAPSPTGTWVPYRTPVRGLRGCGERIRAGCCRGRRGRGWPGRGPWRWRCASRPA